MSSRRDSIYSYNYSGRVADGVLSAYLKLPGLTMYDRCSLWQGSVADTLRHIETYSMAPSPQWGPVKRAGRFSVPKQKQTVAREVILRLLMVLIDHVALPVGEARLLGSLYRRVYGLCPVDNLVFTDAVAKICATLRDGIQFAHKWALQDPGNHDARQYCQLITGVLSLTQHWLTSLLSLDDEGRNDMLDNMNTKKYIHIPLPEDVDEKLGLPVGGDITSEAMTFAVPKRAPSLKMVCTYPSMYQGAPTMLRGLEGHVVEAARLMLRSRTNTVNETTCRLVLLESLLKWLDDNVQMPLVDKSTLYSLKVHASLVGRSVEAKSLETWFQEYIGYWIASSVVPATRARARDHRELEEDKASAREYGQFFEGVSAFAHQIFSMSARELTDCLRPVRGPEKGSSSHRSSSLQSPVGAEEGWFRLDHTNEGDVDDLLYEE